MKFQESCFQYGRANKLKLHPKINVTCGERIEKIKNQLMSGRIYARRNFVARKLYAQRSFKHKYVQLRNKRSQFTLHLSSCSKR